MTTKLEGRVPIADRVSEDTIRKIQFIIGEPMPGKYVVCGGGVLIQVIVGEDGEYKSIKRL